MLKIIYEVSNVISKEVTFNTLNEARKFAISLLTYPELHFESIFINQKIYVDGVLMDTVRIDHFFDHPKGIEWTFKRNGDYDYFDFFLEDSDANKNL